MPVRLATPADAKLFSDRWEASPEADALTQLVAWLPHDEPMMKAHLEAPGNRGYVSDLGILIVKVSKLPEKNTEAEELFVWLVNNGLTDAEHDAAFAELFVGWFEDAKTIWAFGDIPPNSRPRSFAWLRSWCEEEVLLPNKWHRFMCRVDVALQRLSGPVVTP